jgi:hypothetical protein
MDWLESAATVAGAVWLVLAWTAQTVYYSIVQLVIWLAYPIYLLLYIIYVPLAFVLSPVWALMRTFGGMFVFATNLAHKFKVRASLLFLKRYGTDLMIVPLHIRKHRISQAPQLQTGAIRLTHSQLACAAIIGVIAGLLLQSSSQQIFMLFGIHHTQERAKQVERLLADRLAADARRGKQVPLETDSLASEPSFSGGESSSMVSSAESPVANWRKNLLMSSGVAVTTDRQDVAELYENRWRQWTNSGSGGSAKSSSPSVPRKKTRGLLAQTIHEESSESESL